MFDEVRNHVKARGNYQFRGTEIKSPAQARVLESNLTETDFEQNFSVPEEDVFQVNMQQSKFLQASTMKSPNTIMKHFVNNPEMQIKYELTEEEADIESS